MESGGFWSYAHGDDDAEGGRIVRLAQLIKREYGLLTGGDDIAIFVDRDIQWGEEWRRRINTNLDDVTFFIPIITPRYFRSVECRKELLAFAGHAASLGVRELLLPVLYINVPDLSEDSEDEAVALVAKTQYVNWRLLRLAPEDSAEYRTAVNALAERLQQVASSIIERPEPPTVESPSQALDDGDELGMLDSSALTEELTPLWSESLVELGEIATEMNPIVTEAVERMNRAGSAANKLVAARWLAETIRDPAERFEAAGKQYSSRAIALDPAILRMIRGAIELRDEDEDVSEFIEVFEAIHGSAASLRQFASSAADMNVGVSTLTRITKLLRPTAKMLNRATREIQDAQAVVDEWDRQILESGLLPPSSSDDSPSTTR